MAKRIETSSEIIERLNNRTSSKLTASVKADIKALADYEGFVRYPDLGWLVSSPETAIYEAQVKVCINYLAD